ncbi:hypothetical protein AAP_06162 [Ascosphaera apis ARSEF 7405]|uniref:Uncharacterized protein n=1 Tax=Ascosphaera apis ARSEF 7405 TaxID=392613 RepID=A0A162I012_9EURO|nr:hypothetical protein AAP_06162 [Ascosphaera apis ARSEF 7405]
MSFSSEDELAAVEGEAFFQSLVEDADAGPTAAADSGDLEPQLDAEIGSELQISAQIPAMQAQAQMHQQDQYQGEDWVAGDVPPETISTTATPSVAAPTDAVTAATAVPPTIASIAQESPAHIQVLDSTQELDDQLHYQQQRQQPAPATIASAVTSTPEDGFSPVPVVAQQSSISDATSLNTINTNDDTNPVLMQETVPAIPSELPDQSLDPSGWTPHSRNPSQDLSATTISADATISTQLMSNPPSSIPCGTPVEYYRPDPSAPAIATAHFVKENQAQIPAATVNTEEGLGLQTSYSEVPAPTTVVMNREEYEDLGELPKPQRDMPVLSDAEVNAGVSDVEGDVDVDAGIEAEAGVSVATGHNTQQDPVQSQEQQSQDGGVGASMDTGLSGQSTTEAHEPSDVEVPSIQQEVVATQGENSAISISDDTAAIDAVLQQATPIQEQSPANIPPAQEIPVESTSITDFTATQLPGASMNINEPSTEGITTATANPVTDDITQPAPQFVSPSQQDMESMSTDRRPSIQISVASTADESMMSEKDLEERWKAMGIDDAELLDDMMLDPEEDIPVQQLDTPLSQQTPALPTNASSVPSQQPASTAAQVSAQAQLSPQPVVQNPPTNPYIPQQAIAPLSAPASRQPSNSYAPHQPSVSELVEGLPAPSPLVKPHEPALRRTSLGLPTAAASGYSPAQPKVKQPPSVSSFVDKTKEGYQSPYDLPAEFTRPVRRAHPAQPVQRVQGQPQMQGLKAGPPPLQQARLPTTVQGGVVPPIRSQQQPRSVSSSYKPAHPQSRTVPAPVFAPPPPVSRQSAIASPPPSAGNNASFHRGSASQDSKGVGGDNAGAGKITVAASVPSPPATPPGTAPVQMQPQPEPVQSAARSKYAPPSTISVSIQSASIPQPSPTFATPPSQATHRRVSSLTKVGAETGAPTPPSVDVAAQRVPSPKNREVSMTGPQQLRQQ